MINKTTAAKKEQNRKWYFYDASNKVLGMLAADIAKILIGKNNPEYSSGRLALGKCYFDKRRR